MDAVLVRVTHCWYDGPQVALEVAEHGTWVAYGSSSCAAAINAWADRVGDEDGSLDTADWPEGLYRFVDGEMTALPA